MCFVGEILFVIIMKYLYKMPTIYIYFQIPLFISGGGAREQVFWKNYFFHCAFTRYEAGLSIDEIWSYQVQDGTSSGNVQQESGGDIIDDVDTINNATTPSAREEETVVFDRTNSNGGDSSPGHNDSHAGFQDIEDIMAADGVVEGGDGSNPSDGSPNNGFELVDDSMDDDVGPSDPELDELEAEIARELED